MMRLRLSMRAARPVVTRPAMRLPVLALPALALLAFAGPAPARMHPAPVLGVAEGRCRPGEPGPALMVSINGLKDRDGLIRVEVYPANDDDFLADDAVLLAQAKVFRRVEEDVPQTGPVVVCIRVPGPGTYALLTHHDRDGNHKYSWWSDGVGLPGTTRLGLHKPKPEQARVGVGAGLTRVGVVMMYRRGFGISALRGGAGG
jgi:uncharacterized protein (DUF2141 family)